MPLELPLTRCAIRSWRRDDVDALAAAANSYAVWRNLRDLFPHPYTRRDAIQWIDAATAAEVETSFAIAVEGRVVGGVGIELGTDVHRRCGEIGYWLAAPYWGRGIATEVVVEFTRWAIARFDLFRMHALVFETNPASARVLEKAGYALEGRLRRAVLKEGRILDALLYARLRDE